MTLKCTGKEKLHDNLQVETYVPDNQDYLLIKLSGQLISENSQAFTKFLSEITVKIHFLIFDFAGLDYISSTGIGVFIPVSRQIEQKGGIMIFTKISEKVMKILTITGFNQVFTVTASLEEAVERLEKNRQQKGSTESFILFCPVCKVEFETTYSTWHRCRNCRKLLFINTEGKIDNQDSSD